MCHKKGDIMKTNKILKIISIILEASFIGSIFLYIYNYYIATKKYEIIPAIIKSRLNLFVIIAIVTFILFLIIKFVLYLRNKQIDDDGEQLQMDFDEKDTYRDLEAPVTERVFLYKNEYDVPKNRQMHCPNCNSIIDKNAYICIKCGYLIKSIEEKVVEKVVEKPVIVEKVIEKPVVVEKQVERIIEGKTGRVIVERDPKKARLINILINLGLVIAIIITLILIINQAIQRGIIR